MRKKLDQAIDFCIKALNNRCKGSDQVGGNRKFVLETLHKTFELPYEGRNLGIGDFGYSLYRSSIDAMHNRFAKDSLDHSLSWLDALLTLFDLANYDEAEMLVFAKKIVNNDIIFNHVLKHIITNCVVLGDVRMAESYIPNFKTTIIFKEEDNLDQGYLIILKHYAIQGDDTNFFKYFKLSKPAVNKYEVNEAKGFLVKNYARNKGIEQTIALCRHKNLGPKFYFDALMSFAGQGQYQELKQIFGKYVELRQPELETELNVLSRAYEKATELNLPIDDDFEELFERAVKMGRKLRWGDLKLQDDILLTLGFASKGNKDRILRCRKAIKYNLIKQELIIK